MQGEFWAVFGINAYAAACIGTLESWTQNCLWQRDTMVVYQNAHRHRFITFRLIQYYNSICPPMNQFPNHFSKNLKEKFIDRTTFTCYTTTTEQPIAQIFKKLRKGQKNK